MKHLHKIRILFQSLFFLFFLILFFQATFPYHPLVRAEFFLQWSPLTALLTFLSSHRVYAGMIPAGILLFLTIFLGRFFCGWICPLGAMIDFADLFIKRKRKLQRDSTKFRWLKFGILTALVVMALFSVQFVWFFDPLALTNRTFTTALYPMLVVLTESVFSWLWPVAFLQPMLMSVHGFLEGWLLPVNLHLIVQGIPIFLLFLGILSLNLISRRFWCRNVCPLGALLGIFAKFRILERTVDEEGCVSCRICQADCRMNAIEDNFVDFSKAECIDSLDCVDACPTQAVSYKFNLKNPKASKIDFSRRRFLQSVGSGVLAAGLFKIDFVNRESRGNHVRPPGALPEDQFLEQCIRCQECVRVCSTTGGLLQPSWLETGWEGIWSPIGNPREGYCEFTCNLCGEVCPTGAIQLLDLATKQKTKIGTAFFDHNRCIPWNSGDNCMVCQEHCPTPEKAIVFREGDFLTAEGKIKRVKYPYVKEDLCIGCGICVTKCPVEGSPGIFLTAEGAEREEV